MRRKIELLIIGFCLGIFTYTAVTHYHRKQKSMGPIRAIACMADTNGHYCWLRRANNEMFLANFVDDVTMLQGSVLIKDIIYVDRGWWFGVKYQQIVKIVPEPR